jgi:hypothetical protein
MRLHIPNVGRIVPRSARVTRWARRTAYVRSGRFADCGLQLKITARFALAFVLSAADVMLGPFQWPLQPTEFEALFVI